MENEFQDVKFKLSERAVQFLVESGLDLENYFSTTERNSLELRNAGPELVLHGRNKAIAFESPPVLVPTGVTLAMKPGQVACVKATTDLVTSNVFVREVAFEYSYVGEVFISLMNLGESDIVIPSGAIMPARLFCFSCSKNFKIISDLEYLKEKANPGSQDV